MAKLFKRPGSPFWWVRWAHHGVERRKSTGFRHDLPADTRKARAQCARIEVAQFTDAPTARDHAWKHWVESFIAAHYSTSPKSKSRAMVAWRSLSAYLDHRKIHQPNQLTYDHCFAYIPWRCQGDKATGTYKIHHNTALLELKFLHLIMEHAVRIGFAIKNPVRRLGISRLPPKEKPEITPEHFEVIWAALEHEPEWMRTCFQVAFYTGCRLNETRLHLQQDVDMAGRTITFRNPKGGPNRAFTVPMRPELHALFEHLRQAGRVYTFEWPPMPSKCWWMFFQRIGLGQYCFHCLRVTFITRGCRSGLGEREMMLLVNHASTTIHRVYQRWRVSDLRAPLDRIQLPALAAPCMPENSGALAATPEHPPQ